MLMQGYLNLNTCGFSGPFGDDITRSERNILPPIRSLLNKDCVMLQHLETREGVREGGREGGRGGEIVQHLV